MGKEHWGRIMSGALIDRSDAACISWSDGAPGNNKLDR